MRIQTGQNNPDRPPTVDNPAHFTERHFISHIPPTPAKREPTRYCKVYCSKMNANGKKIKKETRFWSNYFGIEKLVVEVQSVLYYLDCDIHFSYVRGHSGNLGNDRADQLAKEATCQDMNLLMSVPLSHWKHLAWERTASSWNTKFLSSPKALWTKRFFQPFINGLNVKVLLLISSYSRF
ncbi:hypothetical protein TNCV_1463331 [Trichonephila clavipes]|uniref:RNase H type-1 domain-containing protein n=1 Tax=Trichonephila clavipes TaxID=2585209 RepID=A0A8X6SP36_TRICX|nr:hypothetical protein TNCV_1463331 [Trichonephila clavipes]